MILKTGKQSSCLCLGRVEIHLDLGKDLGDTDQEEEERVWLNPEQMVKCWQRQEAGLTILLRKFLSGHH